MPGHIQQAPNGNNPTIACPPAAGPGEKNSRFAGGFNACQFGRQSPYFETYFAAMNMDQFDGSCGRCVAVRGTGRRATGKTVIVKIVDACATCDYGDLDFTSKVRACGRRQHNRVLGGPWWGMR